MRSVNADGQWQFRTGIHDGTQMLEAMTDTFTLAGSVFKENAQLSKLQTLAGDFQTSRTRFYSVGFARSARAAGMHDYVIDAQQNRALNFFAKGRDRLFQ